MINVNFFSKGNYFDRQLEIGWRESNYCRAPFVPLAIVSVDVALVTGTLRNEE